MKFTKPVVRDAFDLPSRESDILCQDPSLAQQSFKDDADINVLLERFKVTGLMPQGINIPTYGDFTGVSDYQSAANALLKANNEFMLLPANIRSRFENSPQKFLEFCSDEANLPELRKLGLALPEKAPPEPLSVRVVPEPDKAK